MTESISLFNTALDAASQPETAVVEFYDPPMCCSTGLCGSEGQCESVETTVSPINAPGN